MGLRRRTRQATSLYPKKSFIPFIIKLDIKDTKKRDFLLEYLPGGWRSSSTQGTNTGLRPSEYEVAIAPKDDSPNEAKQVLCA